MSRWQNRPSSSPSLWRIGSRRALVMVRLSTAAAPGRAGLWNPHRPLILRSPHPWVRSDQEASPSKKPGRSSNACRAQARSCSEVSQLSLSIQEFVDLVTAQEQTCWGERGLRQQQPNKWEIFTNNTCNDKRRNHRVLGKKFENSTQFHCRSEHSLTNAEGIGD